MIQGVSAAGAVAGLLAGAAPKAPQPTGAVAGTDVSFDKLLGQMGSDAAATIHEGESVALQGILGQTPPYKVVKAVMAAQQTLHTALAIRDKAVSAYQELAHMTI